MFSFASLTGGKAAVPAPAPVRAPSPTAPAAAPALAPKPSTLQTPSSSSSSSSSVAATAPIVATSSGEKEVIEKLEYKIELLNHINILTSNEKEMLEKRLQMLQYYLVNKTELYDVIKDANLYGSGDSKLNYNINSFSDFLTKFKDHFTANSLLYLNAFTSNGCIVYTLEYSEFISTIQSLNKDYRYIDVEMLYYKFYNGFDVVVADLIDFFLTSDEFKKAKAIISILKHSKKEIVERVTTTTNSTNPFDKPPQAVPVDVILDTAVTTTAADNDDNRTNTKSSVDNSPPPMPDKPSRRKLGGISGRQSSPSPTPSEFSEQDSKFPAPASASVISEPMPAPVVEAPASADVVEAIALKKDSEKKKQPLISDHMSSYFDQLGLSRKSAAAPAPAPVAVPVVPPPKPAKRSFF